MLSEPDILPLTSYTASSFSQAIGQGIAKRPMPAAMRAALEHNAFIFSGFKTHAELSAVSALLLDEHGRRKPFDRFARDVQAINQAYNLNYLRAEYNFAVQSSRAAAQWAQFLDDADLFNLQYRTAGDERVRHTHRPLHGTTLPVDDPFWQQFFPPNGWNCRCTVVQVRKSRHPLSDSQQAIQAGQRATTAINKNGQNPAAIFRFNPGIEQKLFPPRHPYLPKSSQLDCKNCDLFKLDMNPNNKYCLACKAIGICEAESGVQKQAKKNFIEWAKANNYDKYEFVHEAIGSAFLSTSSIRHILSFGSTFYLKLDVLNNLESYLNEDIVIFDEPVEHDKEKILSVKTSIIPYKGNIEKYRKQNIEFTFRLMQDTNKYQIYDILIK